MVRARGIEPPPHNTMRTFPTKMIEHILSEAKKRATAPDDYSRHGHIMAQAGRPKRPSSATNAHSKFRQLQKTDPVAAGEYWRANKQTILSLA